MTKTMTMSITNTMIGTREYIKISITLAFPSDWTLAVGPTGKTPNFIFSFLIFYFQWSGFSDFAWSWLLLVILSQLDFPDLFLLCFGELIWKLLCSFITRIYRSSLSDMNIGDQQDINFRWLRSYKSSLSTQAFL